MIRRWFFMRNIQEQPGEKMGWLPVDSETSPMADGKDFRRLGHQ
jgi:hypothetical protein